MCEPSNLDQQLAALSLQEDTGAGTCNSSGSTSIVPAAPPAAPASTPSAAQGPTAAAAAAAAAASAAVDRKAPSAGAEAPATAPAAAPTVEDRPAALSAPSVEEEASTAASQAAAASSRVAGLEVPLQALRELVGWPLLYAAEGEQLGVSWPRGLLLHGPPGCGKTLLVQAVAEEYAAIVHAVTAGSIFGSYVGESERRLRDAFEAAAQDAAAGKLAIVFLDEVDALCPRREGQRQHEARVVAQLLTLLDGAGPLEAAAGAAAPFNTPAATTAPAATSGGSINARGVSSSSTTATAGIANSSLSGWHNNDSGLRVKPGRVVVVAATNRPNAVDPALRRPGRLDREVAVSVPDAHQRAAILRLHTSGLQLAPDVDLEAVAASCHGYCGADLAALAREAAMHAFSSAANALLGPIDASSPASIAKGNTASTFVNASSTSTSSKQQVSGSVNHQQLVSSSAATGSHGGADASAAGAAEDDVLGVVCAADFTAAARKVGPSITRGAQVEVEPVSWEDIGGIPEVKRRLRQAVEWPLQHADAFSRLGLSAPRGVLLHGPPGCSKTMLARAAATASGATFLPLSCAQLYSMYLGEGEAQLRDCFRRGRMAAPAILFFDEVDALAASRGQDAAESGGPEAGMRLLSTLLTEMDGLELSTGVLVLAATNRPGALDPALLRPGRFDALLYVPPPDEAGRLEALCIHTRSMPLAADVDLAALAADTERFTGAELASICREAALAALREDMDGAEEVAARHFQSARAAIAPALSEEELERFASWGRRR